MLARLDQIYVTYARRNRCFTPPSVPCQWVKPLSITSVGDILITFFILGPLKARFPSWTEGNRCLRDPLSAVSELDCTSFPAHTCVFARLRPPLSLGYPRKDVLRGGLDNVRSEPAAISVKMSIYLSFQDLVCVCLFLRERANHPIISGWIQWVWFLSVLITYPRYKKKGVMEEFGVQSHTFFPP